MDEIYPSDWLNRRSLCSKPLPIRLDLSKAIPGLRNPRGGSIHHAESKKNARKKAKKKAKKEAEKEAVPKLSL
jgi:hypothetical protein